MVVVFDTDVLIPMILPASRSVRLYRRLRAAGHTVAASAAIFAEVREKLLGDTDVRRWLELSPRDIPTFLNSLPRLCRQTPGILQVTGVVREDPNDDMVLAAALEAGAEYLVSEDRHLRKLRRWQGIRILSRDELQAELDRLGVPRLPQKRPPRRKGPGK